VRRRVAAGADPRAVVVTRRLAWHESHWMDVTILSKPVGRVKRISRPGSNCRLNPGVRARSRQGTVLRGPPSVLGRRRAPAMDPGPAALRARSGVDAASLPSPNWRDFCDFCASHGIDPVRADELQVKATRPKLGVTPAARRLSRGGSRRMQGSSATRSRDGASRSRPRSRTEAEGPMDSNTLGDSTGTKFPVWQADGEWGHVRPP